MMKDFEFKGNLAYKLLETDPAAALDLMNDGLKPFKLSMTMEQLRPAMKGLEVMADSLRTGDHKGAAGVLKVMKDRGMLVNLGDLQRANELGAQAEQGLAQQQAAAILPEPAEPPGVQGARQIVGILQEVDGDPSRLAPNEIERLTGSKDQAQQLKVIHGAQAIVEGHEASVQMLARERGHLQKQFELDPSAFGKASDLRLRSTMDPETTAKGRIADLLQNPQRSEQEERELHAKISVYGSPQLQAAFLEKSATNERARLLARVDETRQQHARISEQLDLLRSAQDKAQTLNFGLTSSRVDDTQGREVALKNATRLAEAKVFEQATAPMLEQIRGFEESVQGQKDQLNKQAVMASPARAREIDAQLKDLESSMVVNRSLSRLLTDESPYAIAQKEAELHGIKDPAQREQAMSALEKLKSRREADVAVLEKEKARLTTLESSLSGQLPAADQKVLYENNLRLAHQAVVQATGQGAPLQSAISKAGKRFGVELRDLAKNVLEARGAGAWEAQIEFAALPDAAQTSQAAARVAKKYGVSPQDVMAGIKKPNQPLVNIENKQETASAKKIGEKLGERYVDIQDGGFAGSQQLQKLARMDQLLEGVHTGALVPTLTQIQSIAQSLGVKVDPKLGAKQALEALSNEVALTLRNPSGGAGMPGALSDKDREFLQSMTPGLAKTPEGNRLIIETARKLAQRNVEVAKLARSYKQKHGGFDDGFFDELASYSEAHPLFNTATQAAPAAPYADPEKERRYQEWKQKQAR